MGGAGDSRIAPSILPRSHGCNDATPPPNADVYSVSFSCNTTPNLCIALANKNLNNIDLLDVYNHQLIWNIRGNIRY